MLIEMVTLSFTVLSSWSSLTTHTLPPHTEVVSLTSTVPEKKLLAMLHQEEDLEAFSDNTIPEEEIVAMLSEPSPTTTPAPISPTETPILIESEPTSTPTPPPPTETPTPTKPEPTSTPTPQPIAASPTDLDSLFSRYSDEYHVDRDLLRRIAACESGFNTTSHNTTYGYAGMYQFAESSWTTIRGRMGMDTNPELRFSAEESIRTAAYHIANGGRNAWPNCQ